MRMVLTASARWALAGIAVGVPGAVVATRGFTSLLFATSPADPLTYGTMCLALLAAAVGAPWRPAWRASHLDPADALRAP